MQRSITAAAVISAALSLLTGCAEWGSQPDPSETVAQAYIDEIDDFLASPLASEFERRVLEDHWVSDEELQEAKEKFLRCVTNKGYEATFEVVGTGNRIGIPLEEQRRIQQMHPGFDPLEDEPVMDVYENQVVPCERHTVGEVAMFYARMVNNPDNVSYVELQRQCLEKVGREDAGALVPDDQLSEAITSGDLGAEVKEHCSNGAYVE